MFFRITSVALALASMAMAQNTLTLVSGDGQMIPYGSGSGSAPIVFSVTNGSSPVANQTITFTNSNGTVATSMVPESIITNAAGQGIVSFYPAFIGDSAAEGFSLQAHYGSQVVSFYETSAEVPPTQLTLLHPAQSALVPLTAKAGQTGPQIQVEVEAPIIGPIPNVAIRIIPLKTGTAVPPGTTTQIATCLEAGSAPEGNVFTNSSGVATCTPVFTYPNAALSSLYDDFTFKISVGDSFSFGPFPYSITPAPLTITGPSPDTILLEGTASTLAITGTGGVPPYTFTLAPTSGLFPSGISLETNGQIVGSSTTPGLYPFTVVLTDHTGTVLDSPTYSIAISGGAFADSPQTIPDAIVGQAYSQDISVTGGVPPYKLSIAGLPNGLIAAEDPSNLSIKISGTPTAPSSASLGINVTDALGNPSVLSLLAFQTVNPLVIPSINNQLAVVSSPFQFQVPVSGGLPPYTISATGLPSGLSINATGLIFGVSSGGAGIYPVTVSVTDTIGLATTSTFNLELSGGKISLGSGSTIPTEQAGVAFTQPLAIAGGVPPYTFSIAPNPDQSITISSTGILTGTISASGSQVVAFSVTDSSGMTAALTVNITVMPVVATGGIANAASFAAGSIAPGEIVSIFGSGLGPDTGVGPTVNSSNLVSTLNAGTQVMFGTFAAPILYASATQLNVVVPFEIAPGQSVPVTVTSNGQTSLPVTFTAVQSAPGIFIVGGTNSPTQAAVLNQDLSLNGAANPAAAGSVIVVYATGGGVLSAAVTDGELPSTLINVENTTLTVGGQPATISFAGLAPGFAGLLQINATLPSGLAAGPTVPIVLTIGDASSSAQTATIAVQ
jgi:uncharacterized protein (TIGR03437 family)